MTFSQPTGVDIRAMAELPHLDHVVAGKLLHLPSSNMNPFRKEEEEAHPWGMDRILRFIQFPLIPFHEHTTRWGMDKLLSFTVPLLRTWDHYSGSQPDQEHRMFARASRQRLDTHKTRVWALAAHAKHHIWEDTPFISFTSCPSALHSIASNRIEKRGAQTLTVINPNIRIAKRLPIINMIFEMKHYEVPDPSQKSYLYYKDQYLCLWEVTPDEVVGSWDWEELSENEKWYDEIIMPAFKEHNQRFFPSS